MSMPISKDYACPCSCYNEDRWLTISAEEKSEMCNVCIFACENAVII